MNTKEIKKKGMKGIKTIIYGRTTIVVLAILVQFLLLFLTYFWIRDYTFFVYGFFSVLSVIVVLHLFNSRGTPDLKLVWVLPIAAVPVFGALFYVYINGQPGTAKLKRRLEELAGTVKEYLPANPQVKKRLEEEDEHMARLADYLENFDSSPVYENTQAVYFSLGDEWFPRLLEELKTAEKYIFLEYFIVEEGYVWNSILDILKEKVKQGVEVRMMYDGMCSLALLPNFYPKLLEREGIRCKMFSPIKPVFSSRYNNRDHRKIVVIDGKTAFTGGTNFADEYINKKVRFGHWKDTAIMLKGAAVERFTYMFLEMWNVSEHNGEEYEKYATPAEAYTEGDGYFIPYSVTPFGQERVGKRIYLDILNTARKYVHIMTPYLILDYETIMALTYAAKRGVDVRILMPHIPDKIYAFVVAKTYYNELIEAGVQIYEYTPGFVHAKIFVSDDEKAVVGTVNLDYRSMYHHFECGVLMYRNSQVALIEEDFKQTLEKSQPVSLMDYDKQKVAARVAGKLLRMVAPLM